MSRASGADDGGEAPSAPEASQRPLPLQVTMGLLDRVAAGALDEDYAAVARRKLEQAPPGDGVGGDDGAVTGSGRRQLTRGRAGSLVALALFTLLLTVAAVQAARQEPTRDAERRSLVSEVTQRRERLEATRSQLTAVRGEVAALRNEQLSSTQEGRALQSRLARLGAAVGAEPVVGPGMVVTVDDAPDARSDRERVLDGDLQRLVNGLWEADAEAISINNQRLTQLTAIRTAGDAIHVNFTPLRPPYTVSVIGNPDQLPARFVETEGGAWWLNLRSVYNVRFEMSSQEDLTLPGAGVDDLRVVRVAGADS